MSTTATAVIDGIQRLPPTGMRIIISGGDIGGMMAALECWRKDFDPIILERNATTSPLGDFFAISPSALSTLTNYPSMLADYHRNVYSPKVSVVKPEGVKVVEGGAEWEKPGVVNNASPGVKVSFMNRRPYIVKMLLDQCLRIGIPIYYDQKVIGSVENDDHVVVKTEKGDMFKGDICIAADGVGSKSHGLVRHDDSRLLDSGYAIARVAYPTELVKPDSPAAQLVRKPGDTPEIRFYLAPNMHMVVTLTHDWVGWQYTHLNDSHAEESWRNLRDAQELIDQLEQTAPKWDPAVIDLLRQTPSKVVDWKLMWRDSRDKWTSDGGRAVQLGDCAHSSLPSSSQGATQALEDAITIAECLRQSGRKDARFALKVFNKLRFERTSVISRTGFVNREQMHHADLDAIAKDPSLVTPPTARWMWDHRPEDYAATNYAACLEYVREGKPFKNTNLPPGHVYEPWTMGSEMKREAAGLPSLLKKNGDWGV